MIYVKVIVGGVEHRCATLGVFSTFLKKYNHTHTNRQKGEEKKNLQSSFSFSLASVVVCCCTTTAATTTTPPLLLHSLIRRLVRSFGLFFCVFDSAKELHVRPLQSSLSPFKEKEYDYVFI
jgi:energy-coupling factor transporter transmembrane protein EcfT